MITEELQARFDELSKKKWKIAGTSFPGRFLGLANNPAYPFIILVSYEDGLEVPRSLTVDLKHTETSFAPYIEEVSPYADWPIDTKVLVSRDGKDWKKRYFAGVDKLGRPTAFIDGCTSWSSDNGAMYWENIKLAEGDENE